MSHSSLAQNTLSEQSTSPKSTHLTQTKAALTRLNQLPAMKTLFAQFEKIGAWVSTQTRKAYLPLSVLSLVALSHQLDAQCCGSSTDKAIGIRAGVASNYTDVRSANNGWTKDGRQGEVFGMIHTGLLRGELAVGSARLGQFQDSAHQYTGYFPQVNVKLALSGDPDRTIIPYAGVQGGYEHSAVKGVRNNIPYTYTGGRMYRGPFIGVEMDISELFRIGAGADARFFPVTLRGDQLEGIGIPGSKADRQYAYWVSISYIIP